MEEESCCVLFGFCFANTRTRPLQVQVSLWIDGLEQLTDPRLFNKLSPQNWVADVVGDVCEVFPCLSQRSFGFLSVSAPAFDCADSNQDPP